MQELLDCSFLRDIEKLSFSPAVFRRHNEVFSITSPPYDTNKYGISDNTFWVGRRYDGFYPNFTSSPPDATRKISLAEERDRELETSKQDVETAIILLIQPMEKLKVIHIKPWKCWITGCSNHV